jgi:hypothetical protein
MIKKNPEADAKDRKKKIVDNEPKLHKYKEWLENSSENVPFKHKIKK